MAYGDGSITQIGRNRYKVRVDFGKDPITGKRQVVSRNVTGTKAEARKVRDQIRKEKDNGIKANANKITLSDFIKVWAEAKKLSGIAAPETIRGNLTRLAHIERFIGSVPISRIDAQTIERTYSAIRDECKLGGTSMNHIHILLKNVMQKAVDYNLILRNPCDKVVAPRRDKPNRKALSAEECMRLASCLNKAERASRLEMDAKERRVANLPKTENRAFIRGIGKMACIEAVRIALATGMRRGEIVGLEWGAVDFRAGTIDVVQSRTKEGAIKAPKTKAGIRTIHIDESTLNHLRDWKVEQADALISIGIEQDDSTPVCCNSRGGYLDLANFERFWRLFKEENGFEGLKFHELRHTQATLLVANGVDAKTVQTRMGHANICTTLECYSHPVEKNDEKAADLVGSLLSSNGSEEHKTLDCLTNVS